MSTTGLLVLVALTSPVRQDAGQLTVGSTAPSLDTGTWVKGEAVKSFVKGRTYVVQFWSTWSGPCLEAMPRFNALAERFKDQATFIGVNVWDRDPDPKSTEYVGRVQDWVVAQGPAMAFRVCVDDTSDSLLRGWVQAAFQTSIPAVFVVDGSGKLSWIGSGVAGLDDVIARTIKGGFGPEDAKSLQETLDQRRLQTDELYAEARKLALAGNTDEAFVKLNEVARLDPEAKENLGLMKFELLAEADEEKARAYLRTALDTELKDNASVLQKIGIGIAMGFTPFKEPDYETAVKSLARVLELRKKDVPAVLMAMAEATFRLGKKSDAVDLMERACKALALDPMSGLKEREAYEERLEQFKDGVR